MLRKEDFILDDKYFDPKVNTYIEKAYEDGYLSGFDFSLLIQDLLIHDGEYVLDIGNYENVNAEVALRLVKNIKKYPKRWKKYFMVG